MSAEAGKPASPEIADLPLDLFDEADALSEASASSTCQWCSAEVPAGATECPDCGSRVIDPDAALPPTWTPYAPTRAEPNTVDVVAPIAHVAIRAAIRLILG